MEEKKDKGHRLRTRAEERKGAAEAAGNSARCEGGERPTKAPRPLSLPSHGGKGERRDLGKPWWASLLKKYQRRTLAENTKGGKKRNVCYRKKRHKNDPRKAKAAQSQRALAGSNEAPKRPGNK